MDLYDNFGFLIYSIFSQKLPQNETANEEFGGIQTRGYAYAAAIFCDSRVKSRDWLYELILVDYRCVLGSRSGHISTDLNINWLTVFLNVLKLCPKSV